MLIFSFLISVSALAFEVNFGGSKEEEKVEQAVTTQVIYITLPTNSDSFNGEYETAIVTMAPQIPVITETPVATGIGTNTRPIGTEAGTDGRYEDTQSPTTGEATKPGDVAYGEIVGSDSVSGGYTYGYSLIIPDAVEVKAGAVKINYDPKIFSIEYMGWYLGSEPDVSGTNYDQENAVFAYADPTYIKGEIFYVSLVANYEIPYGYTHISFDVSLKDANQNDIKIINPDMSVYVGCSYHDMGAIISENALAHHATCNSFAEYYYSCYNCGYINTNDTFIDYDGGLTDHSVSKDWISDEESHWHGCEYCNDMNTDVAKHTFGKWLVVKEATKDEDGIRECSCTVCGYTKAENIKYKKPSSGSSSDDDSDEEETVKATTAVATTEKGSSTVTIGCGSSISLSALVILPTLAGGALLLKRRKED